MRPAQSSFFFCKSYDYHNNMYKYTYILYYIADIILQCLCEMRLKVITWKPHTIIGRYRQTGLPPSTDRPGRVAAAVTIFYYFYLYSLSLCLAYNKWIGFFYHILYFNSIIIIIWHPMVRRAVLEKRQVEGGRKFPILYTSISFYSPTIFRAIGIDFMRFYDYYKL